MENGVITNSTLRGNQDVINAQGVGAISSFMANGAQSCDAKGQNCHSLFGGDDSIDYGSVTSMGNGALGTAAQSFMNDGDGTSVSVQTGALTLACGNTDVQTVAGVAVKVSGCQVNSSGDARVQLSVCTAPMRGLPTTSPTNAVPCSADPSDPSYFPPAGSVCQKASCDSEPVGSLNGWSPTKTLIFQANATGMSEDQKTKNGLALVFYPDLASGIVPSFTADSDNMTAVKIVQAFTNAATGQQAVGLKVAYRQKTTLTKEQFVDGANTVGDPSRYTSAWNSVEKLAVNPLIPQYQAKVAQNSRAGLMKLQDGIKKGKVEVFDPNYVGPESGIKPIDTTAKIAAAGEGCGTATECLRWVTNTNTWTQTCRADVPLSMRSCSTVTDYTMEEIHSERTRSKEICREQRTTAQYECSTAAAIDPNKPPQPYCPAGSVLINTFSPNACHDCIDNWQYFKVTCGSNNQVNIYWVTATPNGAVYSPIVNRTITMKPFESGTNYLGAFCADGSGTVPFQVRCDGVDCQYKAWITGNCNGSIYGLAATGQAKIGYAVSYTYNNACSAYEEAK
jgi:hypothetical protein